jgi:hypothetical protein
MALYIITNIQIKGILKTDFSPDIANLYRIPSMKAKYKTISNIAYLKNTSLTSLLKYNLKALKTKCRIIDRIMNSTLKRP